MSYTAIFLAGLLSASIHSAIFLFLEQSSRVILPVPVIYRPIVGITVMQKSTQRVTASSLASAELTEHLGDAVKAKSYFPAVSSIESFKTIQYPNVQSDDKFIGLVFTDLNAKPKIGWLLNTESISAVQVVTIVLHLIVDKAGELEDYFVIESTASKEQTADILKDFRFTSFFPAVRDGKPVSHSMIVEIKVDNLDSFFDQETEKR